MMTIFELAGSCFVLFCFFVKERRASINGASSEINEYTQTVYRIYNRDRKTRVRKSMDGKKIGKEEQTTPEHHTATIRKVGRKFGNLTISGHL